MLSPYVDGYLFYNFNLLELGLAFVISFTLYVFVFNLVAWNLFFVGLKHQIMIWFKNL